jgi:hypothetical protein
MAKRGDPKKNMETRRSIASDEVSGRIAASGMIQPGAHPEFEQPTLLDKAVAAVKRMVRRPRKK